ncbi:undecaprenyldiphospho-muramoylpentapeptide beta-N-acetylglucosaminyltransferase [Candidatus Omnitrophota bacterium]
MKILVVAGGTGGHLFPAIRLVEEIRLQRSLDVFFVTSCRKQDRDILEGKNIRFETLPLIPLQSRKILPILDFVIRLSLGTIKSSFLLFRFRPCRVIGFGGYISGPMLLLAALFRIRTIIHEQNVCPGKTNRILARFVDRIAVSFPETVRYLKRFESKIIVSGNLLRQKLNSTKKTSKKKGTFTVLAVGGSQGSHTLNRLIPKAIGLMQADRKRLLDIIHISGHQERDEVTRVYGDKCIKSRVLSFTQDIDRFYDECDFVIARAGATTVSELLYLAKPSILIPYPHAGGHQRLNAKILGDAGAAILLEEHGLTAEDLRDAMIRLMDTGLLDSMSEKTKSSNMRDASHILIKELIG